MNPEIQISLPGKGLMAEIVITLRVHLKRLEYECLPYLAQFLCKNALETGTRMPQYLPVVLSQFQQGKDNGDKIERLFYEEAGARGLYALASTKIKSVLEVLPKSGQSTVATSLKDYKMHPSIADRLEDIEPPAKLIFTPNCVTLPAQRFKGDIFDEVSKRQTADATQTPAPAESAPAETVPAETASAPAEITRRTHLAGRASPPKTNELPYVQYSGPGLPSISTWADPMGGHTSGSLETSAVDLVENISAVGTIAVTREGDVANNGGGGSGCSGQVISGVAMLVQTRDGTATAPRRGTSAKEECLEVEDATPLYESYVDLDL
ncbi:hypothetical protein B0T24DRAFT_591596 [Lasiosphaeria ovina]|uniref:Uncharacterized protein n=1 Tax=Lasiosphaeria ovina TaxID=92902 RepID=A0AAE0N9M7_9PEZI|nr:hypothetical protein B0T24DRAFT_591596 [Lasiosphaeria ovina]